MEDRITRRRFSCESLVSILAAAATTSIARSASEQDRVTTSKSSRREVIKQELPGSPSRDLILVEVIYPPAAGSPAHLHANGVMAFVISGTIASKVGDEPERTFHSGDAWWEPPGAIHRVSRNANSAEPARLLALYIAPKGATADDLMRPI